VNRRIGETGRRSVNQFAISDLRLAIGDWRMGNEAVKRETGNVSRKTERPPVSDCQATLFRFVIAEAQYEVAANWEGEGALFFLMEAS
jgi:hypothetical protein